jgi:hypothetical protein
MPALLIARDLKGDGMPEGDAVVVAADVIPEADPSEVLKMLRGEDGTTCAAQRSSGGQQG